MLSSILEDVFNYIGHAFRELFKLKKLVGLYLFCVFIVGNLVYMTGYHITPGMPIIAKWYVIAMEWVIACCTDVYFLQNFLEKYRPIAANKRTLSLCLLWSLMFLLLGRPISAFINMYYFQIAHIYIPSPMYYEEWLSFVSFMIALTVNTITFSIMVFAGFYPFLVFEKSSKPFAENLKLIFGMKSRLLIMWILIWTVYYLVDRGVKNLSHTIVTEFVYQKGDEGMDSVQTLHAEAVAIYASAGALRITINTFFIILSVLATTSAYLWVRGVPDFIKKEKILPLFEAKKTENL